MSREKK